MVNQEFKMYFELLRRKTFKKETIISNFNMDDMLGIKITYLISLFVHVITYSETIILIRKYNK